MYTFILEDITNSFRTLVLFVGSLRRISRQRNVLCFCEYCGERKIEGFLFPTFSLLCDVPVFRVENDPSNSLYIYCPLAQVPDAFAMKVPLKFVHDYRHLASLAGQETLDYKPSLTFVFLSLLSLRSVPAHRNLVLVVPPGQLLFSPVVSE
jgi:hypothetical protein